MVNGVEYGWGGVGEVHGVGGVWKMRWNMVSGVEYGWGGVGEVHGVCRVGGVCGVRYLRWSMVNQVEYGWGGVSVVGTALGDYVSAPLHHWTINPQHTTQRFLNKPAK